MKKIILAAMLTMGMAFPLMASNSLPVERTELSDAVQPEKIIIIHMKDNVVVGSQVFDDGLDCIEVIVLVNGQYAGGHDGCKE